MNNRYELFETIERLTGKPLLESELDEICNLFDNTQNKSLRAENAKLREALELAARNMKRIVLAEKQNPNTEIPVWSLEQNVIGFERLLESTPPDPLYAAAPEMLEALEDVWNDCEAAAKKGHAATFDAIRQPTFEKVKKSIAKAKPRP